MKRPSKFININTKVLIFVLTVFCVFSIILSSIFSNYSKPAKIVSGAIVVPLQDGMNGIGKWFTNKADYFNSVKKLTKKNKEMGDLTVIGDNLRQANKVKGTSCLSGDAR